MDTQQITGAAKGWITAWNSGNLEKILDHYTDDVILYSAAARRRWKAADGKLIGKSAVENHFRKAFEEVPGMRLEFVKLLTGTEGVLVIYKRETGMLTADLVHFDKNGKIKEVRVFNE
jgi:ketosteroid isomerase-like protein